MPWPLEQANDERQESGGASDPTTSPENIRQNDDQQSLQGVGIQP
jgi:hypothetical protein